MLLPAGLARPAAGIHPALLDACFQLVGALLPAGSEPWVPVHIERLTLHRPVGAEVWARARPRADPPDPRELAFDLTLLDPTGSVLADILGLRVRRLEATTHDPLADLQFTVAWLPAALPDDAAPTPGAWLLVGDLSPLADELAARLAAAGHPCVRVTPGPHARRLTPDHHQLDPTDPDPWHTLLRDAFPDTRPCRGILHLLALTDAPLTALTDDTVTHNPLTDDPLTRAPLTVVALIQALAQRTLRDPPRLWLVTRGAVAVTPGAPVSLAQAPLWGLARTLTLEHPELECSCIDLAPTPTPDDAAQLLRALDPRGREDQVALRPDGRLVARLVRGAPPSHAAPRPADDRPFRLEIPAPGVLERLALHAAPRRPPGPGEVEIAVEFAGLNFLDVLLALGALPDDDDAAAPVLGGECAGRVVALGPGVTDLELGAKVMALGSPAFATHLTTRRNLVAPVPAPLDTAAAATLPIAFLTAYHALAHLARLRPGERVLIHAAAGGVGMAALQWARHVGAEIYATAGSEAKRALVRQLGAAQASCVPARVVLLPAHACLGTPDR